MDNSQFQFLGIPHITAMVLIVALPAGLSILVRRFDSSKVTRIVCYSMSTIVLTNEVVHWGHKLSTVGFMTFAQKHLPLHICGITVFLSSLALLFRKQVLYELAYFWGLVGTLNAIITPQLEVGYPKYRFFQYFIAHGGIVSSVLFMTWGLRMRPTLKSLFRAYLTVNAYMPFVAVVNLLLGSNYMFLCAPPESKSPFFVGPWPWYLLFLDFLVIPVFFALVYLPFWLRHRPAPTDSPNPQR